MVEADLYKKAVDKFGKTHQLLVAIEEMAEATASISQFVNRGRDVEAEMINELADVCIMMKQMEVIYKDKLITAMYAKLKKLKGHIDD